MHRSSHFPLISEGENVSLSSSLSHLLQNNPEPPQPMQRHKAVRRGRDLQQRGVGLDQSQGSRGVPGFFKCPCLRAGSEESAAQRSHEMVSSAGVEDF